MQLSKNINHTERRTNAAKRGAFASPAVLSTVPAQTWNSSRLTERLQALSFST
jgi:hypothetical protein